LLYTAYSIGASHLVLGTSLTSLSISLISSISQGGGFVVPQAIHEEWVPPFVQRMPDDNSWNGEVRLVRPLRDIGIKECTAWVWWHQFPVVGKQRIPIPKQTIGNLTKGKQRITCDLPSLMATTQILSLGSRETTHQRYPPSPKLLVNLHQKESQRYGALCANCKLLKWRGPRHTYSTGAPLDQHNGLFKRGRRRLRSIHLQKVLRRISLPLSPHIYAILATLRSPAKVAEAQHRGLQT
jgi:hypothetical protein